MCAAHKDLFHQMEQKKLKRIDKAGQYSLLLTLEMDFNSGEEKLYNECTDAIVR